MMNAALTQRVCVALFLAICACPAYTQIVGHPVAVAHPLAAHPSRGHETPSIPAEGDLKELQRSYGKLPISFEPNWGQADPTVAFVARGAGYNLHLSGSEAAIALQRAKGDAGNLIRMQLLDSASAAHPAGVHQLTGTANYLIGTDAAQWKRGIPTYSKVQFSSVYPGIDLTYYGNQSQLEYDFVVSPNADPGAIRLHFDGTSGLRLGPQGDLAVQAGSQTIAFHKPVLYQEINGSRIVIPGEFQLLSSLDVGFAIGAYDHARPLIIDPVLAYSTYFGGASGAGVAAIAVDSAGSAYVTGNTASTVFPVTRGAYQATNHDAYAQPSAFVSKLNAAGTALIYSTYLGGSGQVFNGDFGGENTNYSCGTNPAGAGYFSSCGDYGTAIAVDDAGAAYITGYTFSTDFPVTPGAVQSTNKAAPSNPDTFVAKLNPSGTALVYGTYLGGTGGSYGGGDTATSIAVDKSGDAYVAGYAFSTNFPVTSGAFQTTNNGSGNETAAFVTKLNPTGTALLYSTFLGGGGYIPFGSYTSGISTDGANAIALDSAGDAYVTGVAYNAASFPVTPGAFQMSDPAPCPGEDCGAPGAFVVKLNATGDKLLYGTWLVGTKGGVTTGNAIAVDGSGSAYVTGSATSDFPVTPGAFDTTNGTSFVAKLKPDASGLVYSTFLGTYSSLAGIAVDQVGDAVVAGNAEPGFPTTSGAYQPSASGSRDAILAELNPAGSQLLYSTYLGGDGNSAATSLALDANGGAYLAGNAGTGFPVTPGVLQAGITGTTDGFIAKFSLGAPNNSVSAPQFMPHAGKYVGQVSVSLSDDNDNATIYYTTDGSNPTTASPVYRNPIAINSGYVVVKAIADLSGSAPTALVQAAYSIIGQTPAPAIKPAPGSYPAGQAITITDANPKATIRYTIDGSTPTINSPLYVHALTLTHSETVRSIAISTGLASSTITTAIFTVP